MAKPRALFLLRVAAGPQAKALNWREWRSRQFICFAFSNLSVLFLVDCEQLIDH